MSLGRASFRYSRLCIWSNGSTTSDLKEDAAAIRSDADVTLVAAQDAMATVTKASAELDDVVTAISNSRQLLLRSCRRAPVPACQARSRNVAVQLGQQMDMDGRFRRVPCRPCLGGRVPRRTNSIDARRILASVCLAFDARPRLCGWHGYPLCNTETLSECRRTMPSKKPPQRHSKATGTTWSTLRQSMLSGAGTALNLLASKTIDILAHEPLRIYNKTDRDASPAHSVFDRFFRRTRNRRTYQAGAESRDNLSRKSSVNPKFFFVVPCTQITRMRTAHHLCASQPVASRPAMSAFGIVAECPTLTWLGDTGRPPRLAAGPLPDPLASRSSRRPEG